MMCSQSQLEKIQKNKPIYQSSQKMMAKTTTFLSSRRNTAQKHKISSKSKTSLSQKE